jgi:hypothetical protein
LEDVLGIWEELAQQAMVPTDQPIIGSHRKLSMVLKKLTQNLTTLIRQNT